MYGFFNFFGYQKWFVWNAPCTKRSRMLILGTILSLRASGSNVFCSLKKCQSMLPKRFALRMSWDFACFLFKLRNAGAYIPKGTPCTLHVSIIVRAAWKRKKRVRTALNAPYGHGAVWPCPGANASRGPRSAPGRTSGVESRNRLRKQRRLKVSERKTAPIWRIRVPQHL